MTDHDTQLEQLIAHLEKQLELFKSDPPNTPWQRGYQKALERELEYALAIKRGDR
jgi:hypothetical protein